MKRKENKNDIELIYGKNPVKEAFEANRLKKLYVSEGYRDQQFLEKIKKSQVQLVETKNSILDNMCNKAHQGLVGEVKPYEYYDLDSILRIAKNITNPIIVMLDGITDPHNLGAILRSCDIFGVCGVIIKKHNQVSLNGTVAKTSAGAINYVKVCQVPNLSNAITKLKELGFWVVSTAGSGTIDYRDLKYDFPTCLVVGSEGDGISPLVLKNSDYIVKIPMKGKVNSLNASVAASILLSRIAQ